MYDYDVLCIGAGSGGCASAMRSADLGKKVGLIEYRKDGTGGTCVSRGCIPTKVLVKTASLLQEIRQAADYGIKVKDIELDLNSLQMKKDMTIMGLKFGLDNMLIGPRGIDRIQGKAKLLDPHTVEVTDGDEKKTYTAKNIIIAAGSEPAMIPAFNIDGEKIITSNEALNIKEVPGELIVVGAGALGLEFAYTFNAFGSKVTVVEMMPHVVPTVKDDAFTKEIAKYLKKIGITVKCGNGIEGIKREGDRVVCTLANGETIEADMALVAIGRKLNTKDMGLEDIGVELTPKGQVVTDEQMRTSIPNIYAAGDITVGPQLSHKAQRQGLVAAEAIAGNKDIKMNYNVVPAAIFMNPEIAMVGMTAEEAEEHGIETIVGKAMFATNEKAMCMQKTTGIVKIIARADNHKIIGGFIFGEEASILIEEIATAIQNGLTLEDLGESIHAHPTLSELIMETSKGALGKAFNKA